MSGSYTTVCSTWKPRNCTGKMIAADWVVSANASTWSVFQIRMISNHMWQERYLPQFSSMFDEFTNSAKRLHQMFVHKPTNSTQHLHGITYLHDIGMNFTGILTLFPLLSRTPACRFANSARSNCCSGLRSSRRRPMFLRGQHVVGSSAWVGERVRIKPVLNEDQIQGQHGKQQTMQFLQQTVQNSEIHLQPLPRGKRTHVVLNDHCDLF